MRTSSQQIYRLLLLWIGLVRAFQRPKNTSYLLRELNFTTEEHKVITRDGYILTLFRIPNNKGTPILLNHGFLGTSDAWVIMKRKDNIVSILADNGYDIWLTNQRGNCYSRKNIYMSPEPSNYDFWNFSVDEIATLDLPATIDHILTKRRRKQLLYVGHSMGSTAFLIMCSELPDYCKKFDSAILLAPAVYPRQNIEPMPFRLLVRYSHVIAESLRRMRIYEFFGNDQFLSDYIYSSCADDGYLCTIFLNSINFNRSNSALTRPISEYIAAMVGGTSVNVYEHIASILSNNGYFGPLQRNCNNLYSNCSNKKYLYNIENIDVPIGLIVGEDDIFVDKKALLKLKTNLKRVILTQVIPAPFKHMGFFYNISSHPEIPRNILKVFNKYDSSKISTFV